MMFTRESQLALLFRYELPLLAERHFSPSFRQGVRFVVLFCQSFCVLHFWIENDQIQTAFAGKGTKGLDNVQNGHDNVQN